jgi:hypothetical protein
MNKELKKNICKLDDHVTLSEIEDLPSLRVMHIGEGLEYACQFWASHLSKTSRSDDGLEEVYEAIDQFFMINFLFWIEVLIITEKLDTGVYALNDMEQWYILVSYLQSFH